jgi:hypothetical protein
VTFNMGSTLPARLPAALLGRQGTGVERPDLLVIATQVGGWVCVCVCGPAPGQARSPPQGQRVQALAPS